MAKRLAFSIVYILMLFPCAFASISILVIGLILSAFIWVVFGGSFENISDNAFKKADYPMTIPYRIFGYYD